MEINDAERELILRGLFEMAETGGDDPATTQRINELVVKLGGDPNETFFFLEHG
jgi:hypothetical protein